QLALLSWLQTDSVQSKDLLTVVTGVQVAQEILRRLTGKDQVDVYKEECILAIADYVKSHPRASQQEINRHVEKQVLLFAARVQAL
uniref:Si:ch211-191j22.3 n=1 Tax=Lepisosteus oculatus TaxID=7918 RepID=W5NCD1_LEPOC